MTVSVDKKTLKIISSICVPGGCNLYRRLRIGNLVPTGRLFQGRWNTGIN